jgi:hypothetical protein
VQLEGKVLGVLINGLTTVTVNQIFYNRAEVNRTHIAIQLQVVNLYKSRPELSIDLFSVELPRLQ